MIDKKDWPALVAGLRETLVEHASARSDEEKRRQPDVFAARKAVVSSELDKWDKLIFDPEMSDHDFWQIAATKPFYPRRQSGVVDSRTEHMLSKYLGDWEDLCEKYWEVGGEKYKEFMIDEDCMRDAQRLQIVINAARLIMQFKQLNQNPSIVKYLLIGSSDFKSTESIKRIHSRIGNHLGFGAVTSLHLMTDLGLPVVKPDKFLNFVSVRVGLIQGYDTISEKRQTKITNPLSPKISHSGADKLVTNESFHWEIQEIFRSISDEIDVPMRTLDYIFVKMGQLKNPSGGFARTICSEKSPLCKICGAKSFCAYAQLH